MAYFDDRSRTDLSRSYGYERSNQMHFELSPEWYELLHRRKWQRAFELKVTASTEECSCHGCGMTQGEIDFFTEGTRGGFTYIAKRHGLSPSRMWGLVENGMRALGVHQDDIDQIQSFCFGWFELTPQAMHRWTQRFPDRCPLLDVLCSLDQTCEELNATQDWMLSRKGSDGRTRNDVIEPLPDPDSPQPIPCPL